MFMLVVFCIAFDNLTKDDTIFFQLYHICIKIFGLIQYQTRTPPTGAVYARRRCSPKIRKFISNNLKRGITLLGKDV